MTHTAVCHIPVEMSGDYGISLEAELIARYTFYPECKGERDIGPYSLPISPDEPAHVEVESVIMKIGDKVVHTGDDAFDMDEIELACWEHATEVEH